MRRCAVCGEDDDHEHLKVCAENLRRQKFAVQEALSEILSLSNKLYTQRDPRNPASDARFLPEELRKHQQVLDRIFKLARTGCMRTGKSLARNKEEAKILSCSKTLAKLERLGTDGPKPTRRTA